MEVEIVLGHPEIPIEKAEELFFHEIDFGQIEAEAIVTLHAGITRPVLVLWRRIVQILRRQDERGEKYSVGGTLHAFRRGGEAMLQPTEVHQGRHQRRHLHVRAFDKSADEELK